MNAKQLIERNNMRRPLLTKENEKYYSDMLLYIRSTSISEMAAEELLLELLEQLIEEQREGKTAEEVFGEEPKEYCDRLIDNMPRTNWKENSNFYLYLLLLGAGWLLLADGVIGLLFRVMDLQSRPFSVLPFLSSLVFIIALPLIVLRMFKWTVYTKRPKLILFGITIFMAASWFILINFTHLRAIENFMAFRLSPAVSIAAACVSFLASIYFKKLDEKQ